MEENMSQEVKVNFQGKEYKLTKLTNGTFSVALKEKRDVSTDDMGTIVKTDILHESTLNADGVLIGGMCRMAGQKGLLGCSGTHTDHMYIFKANEAALMGDGGPVVDVDVV